MEKLGVVVAVIALAYMLPELIKMMKNEGSQRINVMMKKKVKR
jgi:uncharacterized protein with PQ loop repeat